MNKITSIKIENAKELLRQKLAEVLEEEPVWLPDYDAIADWLSDNNEKGLLLVGGPGVGKTLICDEVFDDIFKNKLGLNYVKSTPFDMAGKIEEMNDNCPWFIDDIGLEGIRVDYGNRSEPFAEIVYNAEKNGQLLVLTTNMTNEQLVARYGDRIIDRLHAIVKPIVIRGKSLRK